MPWRCASVFFSLSSIRDLSTSGARRARIWGLSLRPIDCSTSWRRTSRSILEIASSSTTATISRLSCAGETLAPTAEARRTRARRRLNRRTDGQAPKGFSPRLIQAEPASRNRLAIRNRLEGEAIGPQVLEPDGEHDAGAGLDAALGVVVDRADEADRDAVVPVVHAPSICEVLIGLQIAPSREEDGPVVVDLGGERTI